MTLYFRFVHLNQMAREVAVSCQAIATMVGKQPDPVSFAELDESAPAGYDRALLLCGEGVHHHISINHKVHISVILGDGNVEIKFIHACNLTGEHPCLGVVDVLGVVDDFLEGDRLARSREVISQSQRKSS